jgi:DNA-binding response OmpR family regulator
MARRSVQLLHVEDNPTQAVLTARYLEHMDGLAFRITCVDNEDAAWAEFQRGGTEFVIIDYHLTQGDGLSCLQRIRRQDALVPIIAISGEATPEIAAELVQAGADDYISKADLTSKELAHSVRSALARADAWRRRNAPVDPNQLSNIEHLLKEMAQEFARHFGARFLDRLDELEAAARQAHVTAGQLQRLFKSVCDDLDAAQPAGNAPVKRLLRPLLLEIVLRLSGDEASKVQ